MRVLSLSVLPICRCVLPSCVYSHGLSQGHTGGSGFFLEGHQPYLTPSLPFVTSYSSLRSTVSCGHADGRASQIQVAGFW